MAGTAMDRVNDARDKVMQRVETVRSKAGGGSGGRMMLMGGGGIGNMSAIETVRTKISGIRTKMQERMKGIGKGRATGGPLDILGGQSKVEKPEIKYEVPSSSSKVIKV